MTKEQDLAIKKEAMEIYGGSCIHPDCNKNTIDNIDDLELVHPNRDGHLHREILGVGFRTGGPMVYRALKKRDWVTDGFELVVMCKFHHRQHDRSGKNSPLYGSNGSEKQKKVVRERIGNKHPRWVGTECSVNTKYARWRSRPDLYPPLTEQEREELRQYWREH